ncbi:class II aldolase/adducin family protein [Nocardia sp. SYP-A9097]|uniref:class II aldolase/adducin family protein n=1 Tax=Nocardia sp. SYP-A9097 TaxID=2663237 RepID=UPI00129AB67F|nr:class II aldolase/adducin family protein [Nocardia sp. SYP-A9097]MRH87731.1 class II aldolase/adducin family protein [Nocardia sp. SYP-A9097]
MSSTAPAECARVAQASRRLAEEGLLIGTAGNVSLRFGDLVAVTPTGAVLGEMSADDVTVVDLAGEIVAGRYAPTSELGLHLDVYHAYPARAIVHTHAPKSTALGCVLDELPVLHYQQLLLGGATPVVPFHPFGTPELAQAVREALRGKQSALLANHGAVALGASMEQAVENALLLEWACALYIDANAIGKPRPLSNEQQAAVIEVALRTGYGTRKPLDGSLEKDRQ